MIKFNITVIRISPVLYVARITNKNPIRLDLPAQPVTHTTSHTYNQSHIQPVTHIQPNHAYNKSHMQPDHAYYQTSHITNLSTNHIYNQSHMHLDHTYNQSCKQPDHT